MKNAHGVPKTSLRAPVHHPTVLSEHRSYVHESKMPTYPPWRTSEYERNEALASKILGGNFRGIINCLLDMTLKQSDLKYLTREYLIESVEAKLPSPLGTDHQRFLDFYKSLFRELHRRDVPDTAEEPNFSILSIYARLGLSFKVTSLISSCPRISAEECATAFEFLQISMFELYVPMRRSFEEREWPYHILEYFRKAQLIRDAEGITRSPEVAQCFTSMGDIYQMENQIKLGYPANFLAQCCLLNLVDARHLHEMMRLMKTHSDLTDFYTSVHPNSGIFTDPFVDFNAMFCRRFESVFTTVPMWNEILLYLRVSNEMSDLWHQLRSDVERIPKEALDCCLNYLLLYLHRCLCEGSGTGFRVWYNWVPQLVQSVDLIEDTEQLTEAIKSFVNRGANLYFTAEERLEANAELASKYPGILREEHLPEQTFSDCKSSLALLLQVTSRMPSSNLFGFTDSFCCSMELDDSAIGLRKRQPVRLTCLAAMACKPSEKLPRLPKSVRRWIKTHQELAELSRRGDGI